MPVLPGRMTGHARHRKMSDFLTRMAQQTLAPATQILPRLESRFATPEPVMTPDLPREQEEVQEISAHMQRAHRPVPGRADSVSHGDTSTETAVAPIPSYEISSVMDRGDSGQEVMDQDRKIPPPAWNERAPLPADTMLNPRQAEVPSERREAKTET